MMDIQNLTDLIKRRRSIFPSTYTGETIPKEQIEVILNNAAWAPNHKKTEPWRFKVFSGQGLQELETYLTSRYKEFTSAENISEMKLKKIAKKIGKSSHIIALCIQRDEQERIPEWEELAALACGVQNMYLSCTSMNIGCYWSSSKMVVGDPGFPRLSNGEKCYGLFYLGVPVEGIKQKAERGNINEKIEWVS